ncbi:MAG: DNA recombination protein RmuC [Holdemanella sp.]|nr:DNA recombination protein RmuC [Holdemanella sp.]
MNTMNIVLLIILVLCLILLLVVVIKNQRQNEIYQQALLKKNEETLLKNEWMDSQRKDQWDKVLEQVQYLQKEQILSSKSMENIENDIYAINQIMTNTKLRGNWGEYQLEILLSQYAAENTRVYQMQYMLENGKIVDAIFRLPDTNKVLCIDSKFPMENYSRILEYPGNEEYVKLFKKNVKRHIDDISQKYITTQTTDYAILFIPSEAIYQYICANCEDVLSHALKNHVMITSPTTLIGITFSLISSTKDFYRANHLDEIERNLMMLQEDAYRLVERSNKAQANLETLAKQFGMVSTSATKIAKRIDEISKGKEEEL